MQILQLLSWLWSLQTSKNWERCNRNQVTRFQNKSEQCFYAYNLLPHIFMLCFSPGKRWAQERFPQTSLFHTKGSSTSTDPLIFPDNPLFPAIPLTESNTTWSRSLPHFQHYRDYLEMQPAAPTQALTLSGAYHSVLSMASCSSNDSLFRESPCVCIAI